MGIVKKWLGIKTPKKISMKQAQQQAAKPIRMGMNPQSEKLTAGFKRQYWDNEAKNTTKLTSLGGGGSLFT